LGWGKFGAQVLVANVLVVTYLYFMAGDVSFWMSKSPGVRLGLLLTHVLAALVIYLVSLRLCGMRVGQFRNHMKE
jgi:putative peptidoglycan lipid II flippase